MCRNQNRRNLLAALNLKSNVSAHRRISLNLGQHHVQIVMITVVLTMTTKVWQKLFSNNSNPSYLNTATPKDLEGKLQTYLKCWFHRPTDTESVSLMMPFHIY